ncbi:MAG TPA: 50S ribosomal protein L17 [Thermoanaerobaculia bacterium]|nr:50S ribosomal protein L17 [Thermoanaerobaculia bacterium]
MRHKVRGRKLGRTSAHRIALFRNQLAALVATEKIVTTLHKAKELRPIAERVITHGRRDSVASRRWVRRWLEDRDLVKKVFDDIAPRFMERPGGYLRIVKLGPRLGDGAEMAVIELVGGADEEVGGKGSRGAKSGAKKRASKSRRGGKKQASAATEKPTSGEAPEEAKKAASDEKKTKVRAKKPAAKKSAAKKPAAKKTAGKKTAAKKTARKSKKDAGSE